MAVEIVMPRLSDSMEEGTILQWFVAEGAEVKEGEPLVEVETDKASVTYEAESDGTVLSIAAPEGSTVAVGAVIAVIGAAGESAPAAAVAAVATPVHAPAVLSGSAAAFPPAVAPGPPAGNGGRVKASPLARRIAAQSGIDLAALTGSGPGGRVIRADVERLGDSPTPSPVRDVAASSAVGMAPAAGMAKGESSVQQLTRTQQLVARRMAESRATVPDFELRCEVDMSNTVALREQLRDFHDPLPSFNDFIVRAVALCLREFPGVNASYRDATIERHSRVNVGIAVASEDSLVVPTIFDADVKALTEIAAEARALAQRVRDGSISPAELSGGTFTVSNLGMYGIDSFSAVINPPQAAILAVGSLKPRPVVDESGAIVARETVHLTLAADHRILYGADGARFLARVRERLEKPASLLLA